MVVQNEGGEEQGCTQKNISCPVIAVIAVSDADEVEKSVSCEGKSSQA